MMLDSTAKFIQDWLAQPREERDVPAGADVMLRLNKNRILYGNILARPEKFHDKLEYELKKHLQIYLDHQTCVSINKMQDEIMPKVEETFQREQLEKDENDQLLAQDLSKFPHSNFAGLRDDHNDLPDRIKNLYQVNGDIYFKMKALHSRLKTMAKMPPCDRYEYLKQLDDLYKQYRENWNTYDNYDPDKDDGEEETEPEGDDPAILAKRIAAARKFISSNSKKLEDALAAEDENEVAKLMPKIQERIDFLTSNNQTFDADYQQKLVSLGMSFE